jgi:hypothetical protein
MDAEMEMGTRLQKFHDDLQKTVENEDDDCRFLSFGSSFFKLLHDVDDESFESIVTAIRGVTMNKVAFCQFEEQINLSDVVNKRLHSIFQILWSMTTVTKVSFGLFGVRSVSVYQVQLIQNFRFLETLSISFYPLSSGRLFYEDLAIGLTGHSSLQKIHLMLPTSSYRVIIPALRTVPPLTEAALYMPRPVEVFEVVDKEAIAALFAQSCPSLLG